MSRDNLSTDWRASYFEACAASVEECVLLRDFKLWRVECLNNVAQNGCVTGILLRRGGALWIFQRKAFAEPER
jgi:hypothetical protein